MSRSWLLSTAAAVEAAVQGNVVGSTYPIESHQECWPVCSWSWFTAPANCADQRAVCGAGVFFCSVTVLTGWIRIQPIMIPCCGQLKAALTAVQGTVYIRMVVFSQIIGGLLCPLACLHLCGTELRAFVSPAAVPAAVSSAGCCQREEQQGCTEIKALRCRVLRRPGPYPEALPLQGAGQVRAEWRVARVAFFFVVARPC